GSEEVLEGHEGGHGGAPRGGRVADEASDARHPVLADAAGYDPAEQPQIRIEVQGEPVHGDPAADAHPDGAELHGLLHGVFAGPGPGGLRVGPPPDVGLEGAGPDPRLRRDAPHDLREGAHVAAHVPPVRAQVEDGVGDELPGSVQRDVAAAPGLHAVDPAPPELVDARQHVAGPCSASARHHRGVLEEEEGVADRAPAPGLEQALLQIVDGAVGPCAEPDRPERAWGAHSGRGFPSARSISRSSSMRSVNTPATSGSNWEPAQRSSSFTVTSWGSARRYARSLVIAS